MAIQTIGGSAASTSLSGTPVLRLQRASAGMQGIPVNTTERYTENVLSTPLPSGNYFFTLTRSTSYTNGGTQVILQLNDNSILGAFGAYSGTATSSQGYFVPAGKTLTKIIFRKPINIAWDETMELSVLASTDATNFYGQGLGSSGTYQTKFNLPALPAGYVKVTNTYAAQNSLSLTKDGTKHYFVAMVQSRRELYVAGANQFPNGTDTINSQLKFYEYNLVSGTLTEKAAPSVFSINVNCGWNPSTGTPQSNNSSYLTNFFRSNCVVGNNVVYFDPGYATLTSYGANTWNSDYFYSQMGSYNIANNTWTQLTSGAGWGTGWYNHSTAVAGDTLVHGGYLIKSGYSTAGQLNFYMSYSNSFNTDGRYYKPGVGWSSYYTGQSTSSYSWSVVGYCYMANDRYVCVDGNYNASNQSWSAVGVKLLDTNTGTVLNMQASGIMDPLNSNQGYSVSGNSVSKQQQFAKDSTSSSHIYAAIGESGTIYRINMDGWGATGGGANISSYATRTKWLVTNSGADSTGLVYIPSINKMWTTNTTFNFTTSPQTSFSIGSEVIPVPDVLFNAGY